MSNDRNCTLKRRVEVHVGEYGNAANVYSTNYYTRQQVGRNREKMKRVVR